VKCTRSLQGSIREALARKDIESSRVGVELIQTVLDNFNVLILDDLHEVKDPWSLYWIKDLFDYFEKDRRVSLVLTSIKSLESWRQQVKGPIPEILSRYDFAYLGFAPYNAEEVYQILKQRAELAFENISDTALRFIAAKSARWRDIRIGLNILNYAYAHNTNLTMESTQKGWTEEKKKYWKNELTKLGHEGFILFLIAHAVDQTGGQPIHTRNIHETYKHLSERLGVEPLYPAAVSKALTKLETLNYIEKKVKSFGRRGLQSEIKLLFDDPTIIVESGKEVDWSEILE
jgi:Cdc6-like AAA superfamily ATPase